MSKYVLIALILTLATTGLYLFNRQPTETLPEVRIPNLVLANNFKVKYTPGCNLLSGYSLLKGCISSPFSTDDPSSITTQSVTN